MRALIVTGGESPPISHIIALTHTAELIIAADSGLEVCLNAGVEPDLVVGDFDSVRRELLSRITAKKIIEYPEDKDYTDTELAIAVARGRGADRITLAGGGAGRLDHLLALRALFECAPRIDEWHTAHESVYCIPERKRADFSLEVNSLVSVFPAGDGATGMRSTGLKWPLDGLVWTRGDYGVSNRSVLPHVSIIAGPEPLILILPLGTSVLLGLAE